MQKVIVYGNLCKEPELKQSGNGKSYINVGIACNTGFGDYKHTEFFNAVFFGKIAETLAKYTNKGTSVLVVGELRTSKYENKEGKKLTAIKLIVNELKLCGSGGGKKQEKELVIESEEIDADNLPF